MNQFKADCPTLIDTVNSDCSDHDTQQLVAT